jgi:hypothetical protein
MEVSMKELNSSIRPWERKVLLNEKDNMDKQNVDVDFLNDVEPDLTDLKQLSSLCKDLKAQRELIAGVEQHLEELKEKERKLSQDEIPNLLLSKGIEGLTLDDGSKVEIKEALKVSLPKTDIVKKGRALQWITNNGGADIIKNEVTIREPDQKTVNLLNENDIPYVAKNDIHASTLKAWFSRKLGITKNSMQEIDLCDIPKEINAFMYKETKIK